ncbi:recombinase family protein [Clostridium sporogenes]|nr:recombinase family protein [Clostridium sporogenes]MCR1973519.1 recombinase family protein [Clostridium sporogenes]
MEHEEYIGMTVNCRSYIPSFKSKKSKDNPSEKWLRFENTHKPLIDRET